jgi:hypothetical protein
MPYNFNLPLLGNVTNEKKPKLPATGTPDLGSLLNQALGAVTDTPSKTTLSNMESGHTALESDATPAGTSSLPQLNWALIGIVGVGLLVLFMLLRR